ncbi:hypothetical protein [Planctomicrobium sp. SH664]|uniref:hypothetical protein n=1 Tax=Planctomicrobium sp. SH664 TaxID=3448125 RepID=UPI003F5B8665
MSRWVITTVALLGLIGAYQLYKVTVVAQIGEAVTQAPPAVLPESTSRPAIITEVASRHFADAPWTQSQDVQVMQKESLFFFTQKYDRHQADRRSVQLTPIALLWHDPKRPDAAPYRMIAQTGRITFENPFFGQAISLAGDKAGRILGIKLDGAVTIDGPDNLAIAGENFIFTEDPAHLYSDGPVKFRYGPSEKSELQLAGTAVGLDVSLIPDPTGSLGDTLPRVSGVAGMLLRRDVVLDLQYKQNQTPFHVHVVSGSLSYDTARHVAEFASQVEITRTYPKEKSTLTDRLNCGWLGLEFDQATSENMDRQPQQQMKSLFEGLTFRKLRATPSQNRSRNSRVKVFSEENQLQIESQDLIYDLPRRTITLQDDELVHVKRESANVYSPYIEITHTEDQQLARLECRGNGQFDFQDPTSPETAPTQGIWAGGLKLEPDPATGLHRLWIPSKIRVLVPEVCGVEAGDLQAWIDLKRLFEKQANTNFLNRPLPLHRVLARGDIGLISSQLEVHRANLIDILIQPGTLAPETERERNRRGNRSDSSEKDPPWVMEGDQVKLVVIHDPLEGRIDLRRGIGEGNINLSQQQKTASSIGEMKVDGPLDFKGAAVDLVNEGNVQQTVTLFGSINERGETITPATVQLGAARISADRQMILKRADNCVEILGPGSCRMPLSTDLEGRLLSTPSEVTVYWWERMDFDGQTASCFGQVKCTMNGTAGNTAVVECESLSARLNQKISFIDPQRDAPPPTLERLLAKHQVRFQTLQYEGTRLSTVSQGSLSQFQFDYATGDMGGAGPGEFNIWSADTARFARTQGAEANQPAVRNTPRWRHTRVRFDRMSGNQKQNLIELFDRVEVLSGPVAEAFSTFKADQLSEKTTEAENGVLLKCPKLTIEQVRQDPTPMFKMIASEGTEIEGRFFRAVADITEYDQMNDKLVMRGLGKDAHLWFQRQPGEPASQTDARMITFIPSKNYVDFNRSSGVGGGF